MSSVKECRCTAVVSLEAGIQPDHSEPRSLSENIICFDDTFICDNCGVITEFRHDQMRANVLPGIDPRL